MWLFDAFIAVACILVLVGGLVFLWKLRGLPTDWEPRERSLGDGIKITLVKKGEKPFVIGIARQGESFNEELAQFRAEARVQCRDFNLGRKLLK